MTQGREHFALDWLKTELDETLKTARQALESYAESERDETRLRSCLTALHQVHGTLLMLELTGVTVLSDELEQLAQAMYQGEVEGMDAAQQLLMQGILQLPAHLEEIQKGLPDSRRAVLVLANDIRVARGEEPFPDAVGLTANDVLDPADDGTLSRFDEIDGVEKARKIRGAYQQVLLSVLKGKGRGDTAAVLGKVAVGLERICEGTPLAVLWRAFGAYVGAVASAGQELSGDVVKMLRRVDAEIKTLATIGREALERPINKELIGTLIDAAAEKGADSAALKEISDALAKEAGEQGATVSGREAMQHAASALREELAAIKDELDLFVRSEDRTIEGFQRLSDPLRQIGSTLSILGFESSRAIIADQIEALGSDAVDDSVLMGIAAALIQVDENLAGLARARPTSLAGTSEVAAIIGDAHVAVLAEARNGLEETKHAVVDYVTAQWDASMLEAVPDLLDAVKGALAMVPLAKPAALLGHCAEYVRTQLLKGNKPDWQELDHFADAISGVDYYLERLSAEGAPPGDEILSLAQRSLSALGIDVTTAPADAEPVLVETVEPESPAVEQAQDEAVATDAAEAPQEDDARGVDFKLELVDEAPQAEAPVGADDEVEAPVAADEEALAAVPDDEEALTPAPDAGAAQPEQTDETDGDLEMIQPVGLEWSEGRDAADASEPAAADEPEVATDDAAQSAAEAETSADGAEEPEEVSPLTADQPAVLHDDEPSPIVEAVEFDLEAAFEAPSGEPVGAPVEETAAEKTAEAESLVENELAEAPAAAEPLAAQADEDIDEEIVEIFVEEVEEVLEAVDEWLPQWADDFANEEALTEARRAFHTLKGSGRIVGAQLIGELAWSIENMLNRIMDGTIEPHGQVVTLVREARHLIPSLTDSFRLRKPVEGESIAAIMGRADVLASGGKIEELGDPVEIPSQAAEVPAAEAPAAEAPAAETPSAEAPEPDIMAPELTDESPEAPEAAREETGERDLDEMIAALGEGDAKRSSEAAPAVEPGDEVMALFEEEALRHLEILESRFNSEDNADELKLDESVMRALHTLRGSSAMAGIAPVEGIASPLYQVATAFKDADRPITSDLFDFLQQGVFALRRAIDAVRGGEVPDEDEALFQAEARRIVSEVHVPVASTASSLLKLDGTSVLLGAGTTLQAWHAGEATPDALAEMLAALHEVRNESQSRGMDGVADLCDGLIRSYERLEGVKLTPAAFQALDVAHELLLEIFDAIAAEQDLPAVAEALERLAEVTQAPDAGGAEVIDFPSTDEEEIAVAATAPAAAPEPELEVETAAIEPPAADVAEVGAAPGTTPTVRLPEDVDQEILEIFFEEADELLESIDQSVHEWLGERDNRVHLENLLRALHTLKGGARLAGLMELGDETHALESYLIAVQNDEAVPDDHFFGSLQRRHDELAAAVATLKVLARGETLDEEGVPTGPDPVTVVDEIEVEPAPEPTAGEPVGKPGGEAVSEAPEEPEPEPVRAAAADEPAATPVGETVVSLKPEAAPESEAPAQRATKEPREMVRVGANLLEELVNLAGENSITRSRIEQVINDFSVSLEEMETTIERIREQLRRLEIETEAQVLFRHERGDGPSYEEFDPLEMDRYSQLQQVSRSLTETASDMLDLKETLASKAREGETLLIQQARINTELQEGLMRTRMVPFSRLLPRLRRIVRQVARDLGKQVEFHAYNAEGELDRNVLERMVPPLEHMLRNSVDHGIEAPELRDSNGKPKTGRIDLRLSRDAGDVVIEITDDGAGIDVETVRAKAIERGLMSADAWMSDEDILQFVLAPGFSTAKSVTQISGRGVGMDVVHSAVKQLGGSISITSMPGQGSRFTVRLPFTVSVNRALMVAVGEDTYAVPLNNIEGIVRVSTRELDDLMSPDGRGFEYAGVPYRVTYLGTYLGRNYKVRPDQTSVPMVLIRSGDHALAVFVDGVQGSREIVVKSLGPQFAGVGGISGATILGDGSVVVILDLITLIRAQTAGVVKQVKEPPKKAADPRRPTCVMVVDDSVTVRKVTSRLLERQGMDVLVAKDGVEAVAMLQERRPDIVLLDIEMPRMDGFEVARQVRHDESLKDLPIVMISSRTGSKHQERAAELGVNRFLGKPFQENELLSTIEELVETEGQ